MLFRSVSILDTNFGSKMDTIKIAVPGISTVAEHSDSGNSATDFTERYRNITLDQLYTVDHEFTAEEWTNLIKTGGSEVLDSMIHGMSEKIEEYCLQTYAEMAKSYSGTPGTTLTAYSDVLAARRRMNEEKAPFRDRNAILDASSAAVLLALDNGIT